MTNNQQQSLIQLSGVSYMDCTTPLSLIHIHEIWQGLTLLFGSNTTPLLYLGLGTSYKYSRVQAQITMLLKTLLTTHHNKTVTGIDICKESISPQLKEAITTHHAQKEANITDILSDWNLECALRHTSSWNARASFELLNLDSTNVCIFSMITSWFKRLTCMPKK